MMRHLAVVLFAASFVATASGQLRRGAAFADPPPSMTERVHAAVASLEGADDFERVAALLAASRLAYDIAQMPIDEPSQREQLTHARRIATALAFAAARHREDVQVQAPADAIIMGAIDVDRLDLRSRVREVARNAKAQDPQAKVALDVPHTRIAAVLAEALIELQAWDDPECATAISGVLGSWSGRSEAAAALVNAVNERRAPPSAVGAHFTRWSADGLDPSAARRAMQRLAALTGVVDASLEALLAKPTADWSNEDRRTFVELKPTGEWLTRIVDRAVDDLRQPAFGRPMDNAIIAIQVLRDAERYRGQLSPASRQEVVDGWAHMNDVAAACALWILRLDGDTTQFHAAVRARGVDLISRYLKPDYFGPVDPIGRQEPQRDEPGSRDPIAHIHDLALAGPMLAPVHDPATLANLRAALLPPLPAALTPPNAPGAPPIPPGAPRFVPSWLTHPSGSDPRTSKLLLNRRAMASILIRSLADEAALADALGHPVVASVLSQDNVFWRGRPQVRGAEPQARSIERIKDDGDVFSLALSYPASAFSRDRFRAVAERFAALEEVDRRPALRVAVSHGVLLRPLGELPGVRDALTAAAADPAAAPAAREDAKLALFLFYGDAEALLALGEATYGSASKPTWTPLLSLAASVAPEHPLLDEAAEQLGAQADEAGPFFVWALNVLRQREAGPFPGDAYAAALERGDFADVLSGLARAAALAAPHRDRLSDPALLGHGFMAGLDGRDHGADDKPVVRNLCAWFGLIDRLDLQARGLSDVRPAAPAR